MNRQQLLTQIAQALTLLGMEYAQEQASDLEIHTEFSDARWSTGMLKFTYDVFLRLDEAERTVYFWQKTTETDAGVCLRCGMESMTQVSAAAFRRAKIVRYGPEGKAAELQLDLGEVAKIIKNQARQNGWRFHPVLRWEKAKYCR